MGCGFGRRVFFSPGYEAGSVGWLLFSLHEAGAVSPNTSVASRLTGVSLVFPRRAFFLFFAVAVVDRSILLHFCLCFVFFWRGTPWSGTHPEVCFLFYEEGLKFLLIFRFGCNLVLFFVRVFILKTLRFDSALSWDFPWRQRVLSHTFVCGRGPTDVGSSVLALHV